MNICKEIGIDWWVIVSIPRTIILYRNRSDHILTDRWNNYYFCSDLRRKIVRSWLENRSHHLGNTFYTIILQWIFHIEYLSLNIYHWIFTVGPRLKFYNLLLYPVAVASRFRDSQNFNFNEYICKSATAVHIIRIAAIWTWNHMIT